MKQSQNFSLFFFQNGKVKQIVFMFEFMNGIFQFMCCGGRDQGSDGSLLSSSNRFYEIRYGFF